MYARHGYRRRYNRSAANVNYPAYIVMAIHLVKTPSTTMNPVIGTVGLGTPAPPGLVDPNSGNIYYAQTAIATATPIIPTATAVPEVIPAVPYPPDKENYSTAPVYDGYHSNVPSSAPAVVLQSYNQV